MGIIRATVDAIRGGFADQWQEVIEAGNMSDTTVFKKGVTVRANDKRNSNKKGTEKLYSLFVKKRKMDTAILVLSIASAWLITFLLMVISR